MHKLAVKLMAAATTALFTTLALAQTGGKQPEMTPEQKAEMEAYMKAATPGPQHQALAATVGTYDLLIKSWPAPGAPPMEDKGTATRSVALGGRVLVEEITSMMMGMPYSGHGSTGYDNARGKFWSTWNDTMGTGLMVSEGTCDAAVKNCTYRGTWYDPVKKAQITSRMTSNWISPTVQIFDMYGPGPDGKEMRMMQITYTKK